MDAYEFDPTEAQLEILSILWESERAMSVAEVRSALMERVEYEYAYTSVLAQLQRMTKKGWLAVDAGLVINRYEPRVSLRFARDAIMARLERLLYDGTTAGMIIALIEEGRLSRRALERVRLRLDRVMETISPPVPQARQPLPPRG